MKTITITKIKKVEWEIPTIPGKIYPFDPEERALLHELKNPIIISEEEALWMSYGDVWIGDPNTATRIKFVGKFDKLVIIK